MTVPSHRRSHSAVRARRSHMALKTLKPQFCPNCNQPVRSHMVCPACGFYKGKQVMTTKADVKIKRTEKRKKQEQKQKEKMNKLKN